MNCPTCGEKLSDGFASLVQSFELAPFVVTWRCRHCVTEDEPQDPGASYPEYA